jgi:hypothetical protein
MTEIDELDHQMDGLKRLLKIAWSDLANPVLGPLERRETLNQLKLHSAELRRCLEKIKANHSRIRGDELGIDARQSAEKPKLRLLG